MKSKNVQLWFTMLCIVALGTVSNAVRAQQINAATAAQLIKNNAAAIGLSKKDIQDLRISDAYVDKTTGAAFVYAQQTFKGIDVFNSIQTYAFKNGQLISSTGSRMQIKDELVNEKNGKAALAPADAVKAMAAHLKLNATGSFIPLKQKNAGREFEFGMLNISSVNVKSKLIWLPDETEKKASLTWQVEIQPKGLPDYWLVNVDALNGVVISKINLNINCTWNKGNKHGSGENNFVENNFDDDGDGEAAINQGGFRVIPFPAESPVHPGGTPSLHVDPWNLAGNGNNATTLKWNDDGVTSYDSSRGNNVLAQEDVNGNNGLGRGAQSTRPLPDVLFNYKPHFNKEPLTPVNQQFGITNLFYWNNIIHDISYQYGFDEVSGNFQANNLGRGGLGNDFVFADAQDGFGSDNANFSTPPDGTNPKMQMYLFSAVPVLNVVKPNSFSGIKNAVESGFSINNKIADIGTIRDTVVLYADDVADTSHRACSAAFNGSQLMGKIALIDRGDCSFTVKVKNAQNAGAVAVIVVDNIPGEYPIIMGGTDNSIVIPAMMVSYETGDSMKTILQSGNLLRVILSGGVKIDGDLDNGVITHEYTHGISNRLTGGPNNVSCLSNKEQMGEGWSDYMALMVTTDWSKAVLNDAPNPRPMGTYVFGQQPSGTGIRYYPYSTDFSVNPWTYDSMALSSRFSNFILLYSPHAVGEVWCNMLWNMTWGLIKKTGSINTNIYDAAGSGGNNIALQLIMTGMKLQPCRPGFVDGRDAILKADSLLYGGIHVPTIWKVFASRGLGYYAVQGSTNNIKDGIADYSLPPSTAITSATLAEDIVVEKESKISVAPNPAKNSVTITVPGNKKLLTIDLISAAGQHLKRFNMSGETMRANLPAVAPGLYYIKISGENIAEIRKLMIQ